MLVIGQDGRVLETNEACREILGLGSHAGQMARPGGLLTAGLAAVSPVAQAPLEVPADAVPLGTTSAEDASAETAGFEILGRRLTELVHPCDRHYLRSIPVRGLKLSKEFVEKLGRDPAGWDPAGRDPVRWQPAMPPSDPPPSSRFSDNQPAAGDLVRAIVTFAHSLGLSVTSEGIETPEQATSLRRYGIDLGQGHLFGEPMTEADFDRRVLRHDHGGSSPA